MADRRTFTIREKGSNKVMNISSSFKMMGLFNGINFNTSLGYSVPVTATHITYIMGYFKL